MAAWTCPTEPKADPPVEKAKVLNLGNHPKRIAMPCCSKRMVFVATKEVAKAESTLCFVPCGVSNIKAVIDGFDHLVHDYKIEVPFTGSVAAL